jgi:hypothetical protein
LQSAGRYDTIILQGKGRGNKMWGIPNSAVYGTFKKMKHHTKKSAKSSKGSFRVVKDTSLHKERSVEELRKLLQHAE